MKAQTALVLGATGLIGSNVVELLLADETYEKVIVLVRKEFNMQHPKLVVQQVNFNDFEDFETKVIKGDSIFCCIGTTMKQVGGDKNLYRTIDHDIAVNSAKFASAAGYKNYLLVSSVGADATSKNFYLQLKGEVENAIQQFSFKGIHIFQPSILTGKRNESRPIEMIAKVLMSGISLLFFGALSKYKAINAATVAKAMVAASKAEKDDINIYRYNEMIKLNNGMS